MVDKRGIERKIFNFYIEVGKGMRLGDSVDFPCLLGLQLRDLTLLIFVYLSCEYAAVLGRGRRRGT